MLGRYRCCLHYAQLWLDEQLINFVYRCFFLYLSSGVVIRLTLRRDISLEGLLSSEIWNLIIKYGGFSTVGIHSIYRVPSRVLQQLESIRNRFFNGNELGSKKAIWIKWSNALADKAKGGLGVSSLYALNRGLMIKWLWRFYAQNTSLWVRVVKAIHGEEGKVGQNISSRSYSCWLNIVKEVSVLQAKGVNVMNYVRLKLGNGESTSFWEDNWINDGVLKDVFPRLYNLEMWGAEQLQLDILSDLVREVGLVPMSDRYIWSLEGSGDFSVASIRKVIDDKFLPNVSSKTRWVKYVPIKVNILAWKVKMEALPVRFNISRRGIDIGSIVCPVCESGVETASHLFFKCSLLRQIARKVSSWWNVDYVDANSYEEWLDWLGSLRLPAKLKFMLEGVFYVVWWYIWSHRNKTIFESKAPLKSIIFDDVISSSF
ncbi:RNA-directed DNA polymerase, eukaryota, reverse transcriptase zinc-binding domain protein [Tanacetum coccineum]